MVPCTPFDPKLGNFPSDTFLLIDFSLALWGERSSTQDLAKLFAWRPSQLLKSSRNLIDRSCLPGERLELVDSACHPRPGSSSASREALFLTRLVMCVFYVEDFPHQEWHLSWVRGEPWVLLVSHPIWPVSHGSSGKVCVYVYVCVIQTVKEKGRRLRQISSKQTVTV